MTPCEFCHCSDPARLTLHQIGGDVPAPYATLTLCEPRGPYGGCVNHVGHWDTARRLGFLALVRPQDASVEKFERLTGRAVDRGLVAFWRTILGRSERAVSGKGEDDA